MKISYYKAILLLCAYLCALNFMYFSYVYKGLLLAQNAVLLGAQIFVGSFFIILSTLFLLAVPRTFKVVGAFLIVVAALSSYFMSSYAAILNKDMMINVLETDQKEAFSYLNLKFILWILFFAILPSVLLSLLKLEYKKGVKIAFLRAFGGFACSLCVAGLILFVSSQSIIPFFRNNPDARKLHLPYFPLISFGRAVAMKLQKPKELEIIADDAIKAPNNGKAKLLVFVLGETARAQNYSALGYSTNDTNAFTKAFVESKNALYFDAKSCGTLTAISVPCMFSHLPKADFSTNDYAQNALDVLVKTGINAQWIGNNTGGCKGVCERIATKYIKKEFDDSLLEPFKEYLQGVKSDSIVVLHLQGSHGPTYYQRYQKDFARFSPTCDTSDLAKCDKKAIANTYDNTILYTDLLISKLIAELEAKTDVEGSLLYISDHGESLGENGLYLHGMPYAIAPDAQTHVPLMFYSVNKDLVAQIKQNESFSQDYIFHTLLGFFGVKSKYYEPKLDMFNHS